ncbi:hypothetical protein [Texcoconibacillus texcoconensis]|uniref:Uncharacterized protein n=1 Tax=Texcoconibacillus texcoconensis TaxID=1095777 RepID=A0A840QST3_9BACI|nr:hypothetical protein [Texcoconibacillus texcoconensis]MBB5174410.1 hypothetical protein [Texcoconibacillus texcoconensis]
MRNGPFKSYRFQFWTRRFIDGFFQILLPLILFQLIRTLLFPSTFDVILLAVFSTLYIAHLYDWI